MSVADSILKKLTTRNILANGIIGVFLWSIVYGTLYIEKVSKAIESSSLLAALVGVFITLIPIIIFFYFRKPQKKETS